MVCLILKFEADMWWSAEVRGREWKTKLKNPGLPNRNFWRFILVCTYSFSVFQCYASVLPHALEIQEHVKCTQGNDQ